MKLQTVERVVDAREKQQRVILWLKCKHKLSLGFLGEDRLPANWVLGGNVVCPECPDPPPAVVPPLNLYGALLAEGFTLPIECVDVTVLMPADGLIQLRYVVNPTREQLAQLGRAIARLGS